LRPGLRQCVRCGDEPGAALVSFHVADGGLICGAHGEDGREAMLQVHLGTLRALEKSLGCEIDQLPRLRLDAEALAEAEEILFRFHRFHVGFELKSERFLGQSLAGARLTAASP